MLEAYETLTREKCLPEFINSQKVMPKAEVKIEEENQGEYAVESSFTE